MRKRSKLVAFAEKSDLMRVDVKWGSERFRFNLYEELAITEGRINEEVKSHPTSYAFLNMLYKKLILKKEHAESVMEKAWSSEYARQKRKINPVTNRPTSDDLAKAKADTSPIVKARTEEYYSAKNDATIMEVAVKAFESRANLIQTLSANIRNDNK